MRLWHCDLLPYLPDSQFKGQLRELVAIMHDWRDKGKTNHLLINRVMEYPKNELTEYFWKYAFEYFKRYNKHLDKYVRELVLFCDFSTNDEETKNKPIFDGWHNKEYLRICMSNLLEKHRGIGKSRITDEEWARLCDGYKTITGEVYEI